MTENEKRIKGLPYFASDREILEKLNRTKDVLWAYNALKPSLLAEREQLLRRLLGKTGQRFMIMQPFFCDFGDQIEIGEDFFANTGLTILDEGLVRIGSHAFIGPHVSIYTACHPTSPDERNRMIEWGKPVTMGDNVWVGGNVTICPGVTIGDNVTIGAGSVVVKDIPSNSVAVGNPARVIKSSV